ncbi:M28 family peptidase [bacterium]|nr:M28 family peptidase [candidate division CSSED10-310 bacterium]
MREFIRSVAGEVFTTTALDEVLKELCLTYGPRFAGSIEAAAAANYMADWFNNEGLANVALETFPLAVWQRGAAHLEMTAPVQRAFPCLALPYSAAGTVSGPIVDLGMCTGADVRARSGELPGAIALVDDRNPPQGPALHRLQKYVMVRGAGAAAFLFVQAAPGGLEPTGTVAFNQHGKLDQTILSAGLSHETGAELRARACGGPMEARLTVDCGMNWGTCHNVAAELPGETDELVILCGHYDGHDISHGAVDNASGTAAVMETMRILKQLKPMNRCTVRAVLFSAEEVGLVGSNAYVQAHRDELTRIRLVLNLDCFSGDDGLRLLVQGSEALEKKLAGFLEPLPDKPRVFRHLVPFSDHFPFHLAGAASAFCCVPSGPGRGWGHTIADTHDKLDIFSMRRALASFIPIVASTAGDGVWPPPESDRDALIKELTDRHLEDLLRYEGHWPAECGDE